MDQHSNSYQHIAPTLRLTVDPRNPKFFSNPYSLYADWHRQNPLLYWENYQLWCIAGFKDVDSALRDKRFGRQILHRYQREEVGLAPPKTHLQDFYALEAHSLLTLEPPAHSRLRSRVNLPFAHRRIQAMRPDIEALAKSLLADLISSSESAGASESRAPIDLLGQFAAPFAATVVARLIGIEESYIPDLLRWSNAIVRVYTLTQSEEEEHAANQAAIEFREFLQNVITEKKLQPAQDLLSELLAQGSNDAGTNTSINTNANTNANKGNERSAPLSDDEIISLVVLILNAGHEATVHQIGNAVKTLLEWQAGDRTDQLQLDTQHPLVAPSSAAQSHPSLEGYRAIRELFLSEESASNSVQELMRIDTPLHLFTRYALEPLTLELQNGDSLKMQPGEEIGLLLGAANHDPLEFQSPEIFNPQRQPLSSLSLGAGIHFCLGAALSRLEIQIALQSLFCGDYCPQLAAPLEYADSFHFRGLKKLPVTFRPC